MKSLNPFNKTTAVRTFKHHAMAAAESVNYGANTKDAAQSAVKAALFDNPACGLVPSSFVQALSNAFDDFMVVDAVEDVCNRLTFDGTNFNFNA